MSIEEKILLKVALKEGVDVLLPKLIAAEEARLPVGYQALVSAVVAAVLPGLQKALDEKIDSI